MYMAVVGYEWLAILFSIWLAVLVVPLVLAIKFPSLRIGLGAAALVLGIILSFIPLIGIFIGILPILLGVFLLGWGLASRSEKEKEVYRPTRICVKCGRDLSRFPEDIRRCPYCGNELV